MIWTWAYDSRIFGRVHIRPIRGLKMRQMKWGFLRSVLMGKEEDDNDNATQRRGWRPMAGCRDSRLRLQTSIGLCMLKYPKYRFNKYDFRRKAHWFKKVYFNDKIVRISKCSSQWPTFAPTYDFQRTTFIQNRTSISYLLEPSLLQVSKSKIK